MTIEKTTAKIGLEKPVKILHVSDTHLTCADGRDNARKQLLGIRRKKDFDDVNGSVERYLNEMVTYAKENCDVLVHTGDLIDFVSEANLDAARRAIDEGNWLFISGNHEFSQYVGEAYEDENYKMNAFRQVRSGLGVDLLYSSKVVGGVNIIGIDNSYYQFENWHLERVKIEAEKGLPMILCMHTPLYTTDLYEARMKAHNGLCSYLVGCDERHLMAYDEWRAVQQRPTKDTLKFIDYVMNQPLIKCVLAGHIHEPYEGPLANGIMQYVAGGGYTGYARELTLM